MTGLSETDSLLGEPDIPHERLALASESAIGGTIQGYMRDRLAHVRDTRRNLASNPDMVFELDMLISAAMRDQDIREGSLYQRIIADHIRGRQIDRAIIGIAVAVFAIAAGLLSGGTGTVAVLGAVGAAGIGAHQAFEEYCRYERELAAHGAQLLSDDPSFAWVIVAIVGAGIDLGAAGAALRSLRFRAAVEAFNTGDAASDVTALERSLEILTEIDERIRQNVVRAARAEAEARAAWRSVRRPAVEPGLVVLRAVIVPGGEAFGRLVYAIYLSMRRGLISFERFVATREAIDLIGDVARLTPEELTSFKSCGPLILSPH